MPEELKVICRTPTTGRAGTTRIPKWKYDCVRQAILNALDEARAGEVRFMDLAELVKARLTRPQITQLGSIKWHVTTVKLNMEVEGEITRIPRRSPQTLQKIV